MISVRVSYIKRTFAVGTHNKNKILIRQPEDKWVTGEYVFHDKSL